MVRQSVGRPWWWGRGWALTLGVVSGLAWAGPPEEQAVELEQAPRPVRSPLTEPVVEQRPVFKPLPAAIALVPGVLLHGLGPLVAGDTRTAGRLFLLEGAGLGMFLAGGVPIALTGASRSLIGPLYAVTLTGAGLFSLSTVANLYGAVAPAFEPGLVSPRLPPLELELGYQYVADRDFQYRHFLAAGVLGRWRRVRLEAGVKVAPDEGNLRVRVGGAWRVLGAPEAARGGAAGSALDVEVAGLMHRFASEGFSLGGGELSLKGRYDMEDFSPRLAGSFVEMGAGLALQQYTYPDVVDDVLFQQLLFTFGYGVYLGRGGPFRGEVLLYYDHRKDDFPGGIRAFGGGPAYFGLRGRVFFTPRWGAAAEVQAGSALVGRISLVHALGGEP